MFLYPNDDELETISNWPHDDYIGLMKYIRERWQYADVGYWEQDNGTYSISTGGWSGNEDLIAAMRGNVVFWGLCWQSSSRGGHYVFIIPIQYLK